MNVNRIVLSFEYDQHHLDVLIASVLILLDQDRENILCTYTVDLAFRTQSAAKHVIERSSGLYCSRYSKIIRQLGHCG
jgi:hypothetical protein